MIELFSTRSPVDVCNTDQIVHFFIKASILGCSAITDSLTVTSSEPLLIDNLKVEHMRRHFYVLMTTKLSYSRILTKWHVFIRTNQP